MTQGEGGDTLKAVGAAAQWAKRNAKALKLARSAFCALCGYPQWRFTQATPKKQVPGVTVSDQFQKIEQLLVMAALA